jgi:hypothetical protein
MATEDMGCLFVWSEVEGFNNQPLRIVGESPADLINRMTCPTTKKYCGPLAGLHDAGLPLGRRLRSKNPIDDPRFFMAIPVAERYVWEDEILKETGKMLNDWCRAQKPDWVDLEIAPPQMSVGDGSPAF